MKVVVTGP